MENFFYFIWIRFKYNGNDVFFLNTPHIGSSDPKWNPLSENLDKAHPFTHEESLKLCSENEDYERITVQDAHRISCLHVSASKLKKEELKKGEPCLRISKRDQCGKNASFWFLNGNGYGSDVRCSEIYSYDESMERSNREFEYFVKFSKALKYAERRVDIQDINKCHERECHHSVSESLKILNKRRSSDGN